MQIFSFFVLLFILQRDVILHISSNIPLKKSTEKHRKGKGDKYILIEELTTDVALCIE